MTLLPSLPAKCGSGDDVDSVLHLEGRPLPVPVEVNPTSPPRPILTLQGRQATLYVELIQASPHNLESNSGTQSGSPVMLWVRPLSLKQGSQVWNLRSTSDLLWPAAGFVPAYAEDILPLMEQARDPQGSEQPARQLLQEFLQQAWEQPSQS
ncbi:hypothetical protein L1047_00570 [Synechococcus sp. Nb3U1]|uniref:hypothetical protein n=1 Tax=Synechococcus sp. Nb3U1 TaxID=1914529 RepID=UPI001F315DC4|nr:hypothetical protein [Synechococcus sp. Nb3U1]MCF2969691.1 hypothetical protein [Synechococcus sp. Nb3U1]